MWVAFAFAGNTFFQQKYLAYTMFNDQSFNDRLTNDFVSFE